MKLILASTSPRRSELLASMGLPFETTSPRFEEYPTNLPPAEETLFFAEQKARSVASHFPHSLILASDTLIECEGRKIGKPKDKREASNILQQLSAKTHLVYTAVVLFNTETGEMKREVEEAAVTFRKLSEEEIEKYVATGEPLGKAGAYALQGKGSDFITRIEGDRETVIGLPLKPIRKWLRVVWKMHLNQILINSH